MRAESKPNEFTKDDSLACCYEFTGRDTGKPAEVYVTSTLLLASDCLPGTTSQIQSTSQLSLNHRGSQ